MYANAYMEYADLGIQCVCPENVQMKDYKGLSLQEGERVFKPMSYKHILLFYFFPSKVLINMSALK